MCSFKIYTLECSTVIHSPYLARRHNVGGIVHRVTIIHSKRFLEEVF